MPFARRYVLALGFACGVHTSSAIPTAFAQTDESISIERRDAARKQFEQGERAYAAHDYELAAKAFDEAYRIVPHYASLWNAARAWEHTDNRARAANAYAKYLRNAPADAPDRDTATEALARITQKLGRIEVYAAEMDVVRVNDEVVEGTSIYVNPGTHVIEGQYGDSKIKRTEIIAEGDVRSVALVKDKPDQDIKLFTTVAPVENAVRPVRIPTPMVNSAPNRSPSWFGPAAIVAGGATAVSASLLIWSGMDTLSARKDFDSAPTTDKLEAGLEKQLRTNLLIGTTAASGIATGVFLSLWKWSGSPNQSAVIVLPPAMGLPMQFVVTRSF